jgi:hypothetical protein
VTQIFLKEIQVDETFYYRYTDLPSLIHILSNQSLTLLDPRTWDDKNDSRFIDLYREKKNLASVLALCFSQSSETYHHWRIFAPSSSGIYLMFNAEKITKAVSHIAGLKIKPVDYLTIRDFRSNNAEVDRLPFIKRFPFKPENEVRMLWESDIEERSSLQVPIPLSVISRITLSPWLHSSLVDGVKRTIKSIPGCSRIKVYKSTLISNDDWIKHGESAI